VDIGFAPCGFWFLTPSSHIATYVHSFVKRTLQPDEPDLINLGKRIESAAQITAEENWEKNITRR
jgi:hypothetical protein